MPVIPLWYIASKILMHKIESKIVPIIPITLKFFQFMSMSELALFLVNGLYSPSIFKQMISGAVMHVKKRVMSNHFGNPKVPGLMVATIVRAKNNTVRICPPRATNNI